MMFILLAHFFSFWEDKTRMKLEGLGLLLHGVSWYQVVK